MLEKNCTHSQGLQMHIHTVILLLPVLSGFNERKQKLWKRDNQCGCLLFHTIENDCLENTFEKDRSPNSKLAQLYTQKHRNLDQTKSRIKAYSSM